MESKERKECEIYTGTICLTSVMLPLSYWDEAMEKQGLRDYISYSPSDRTVLYTYRSFNLVEKRTKRSVAES